MNKRIIFVIILFILAPFILISCDLSGYCGIFYGSDEDCPLLYGEPELFIEEELVKKDGLYHIGELPHVTATPAETNYIEKNVTIRNNGNDLLYLNQISFYNYSNAFEVIIPPEVDITQPLEEDGEISFLIRFTPAVQGDITSRLDVTYMEDGESVTYSYNISGETLYPEPLLTLKGTDIEISEYYYENVHIEQPEDAIFILKNTGNYDLNLNSISLLNGVTSYNVSYDTSITSLAPEEEMEITVTFDPIDIGSYQDTLSIDANLASSPLSVLIDGYGVEYNLSLANYIYMDNLDGETAPYDPANIYLIKNNEYVFAVDINNTGRSNITESFKVGFYLIEEEASEVTPLDSLLKEITIDGLNTGGYLSIEEPVVIPKELKIDMDKNYKLAAIVDTGGDIPETMETDNNQIPTQILVYHYDDFSSNDPINNLFFIKMRGIIYVDDNDSSDSNIGSPESPMATIGAAINKINSNPDYAVGEIRLFEGVYNISQTINMVEKISIRGGFTRDNWDIPPVGTEYRDHPSVIQYDPDAGTSSGTITQPIATITIGSDITRLTKLEGLFIKGKDSVNYSTAVYVDNNLNYYQQFINCDIISGSDNNMASYGIYYNSSNGVLSNIIVNDSSEITGDLPGQGSPESFGVYVNSGNITAYGNYVNGGYGSDTYGFYLNNNTSGSFLAYNFITGNYNKTASVTINNSYGIHSNSSLILDILNNVIYGSHRSVSNAHGISNVSTPTRVLNNTIYTGDGTSLAYGIKNDTGSTAEVRNNIIFGNGIGDSYDIHSGVSNVIKHNNSFDFDHIASTTQIDRNISVDLVDNGGTTYFESFNVDIVEDNLQLIDDTPLAVRQGGLNLLNIYSTYNYNYDMNLVNRTELPVKIAYGWSMGAFENNSTNNSGCVSLTLYLSDPNGGTIYPETISAIPNLPYNISAAINVSHNWMGWTTTEPTIINFNSNTQATYIEFLNADEGDISADIIANADIKQYNLTVQTDGTTGSQITVNGGTPSGTVTEVVDYGTLTDISAITPTGWRFDGWTPTGTGVTITDSASENTTVSLTDGDAIIQANFVKTYQLTVGTDGTTGASTNPSGTITVDQGIATNISATVPTGYNFVEWVIISGSPNIGNINSASTTVILDTEDAEIQATYSLKQYSLSLQTSGSGTINPTGTMTVGHGVETSITATPDTVDIAFVGWTVESGSGVTIADPSLESTTVSLTNGNATIQANFEQIFSLTFNISGTMTSGIEIYLTPHAYSDSDDDGDNITTCTNFPCQVTYLNNTLIEATINNDDNFMDWSGDITSSVNPVSFTITSDMSIMVLFN